MGGSGYAGYAPGHKVADLATPLQQYLKAVKSMATLDTLEKLTRNSAQAPAEEKFRKVRARPTPRLVRSPATPPTRRRALRDPARPPVRPPRPDPRRFLRSETERNGQPPPDPPRST
jgi:hypothetical protein